MAKLDSVHLEGVYPILATPFDEQGNLDEHSLRELVRFQIAQQVNGIALFGNASEMYTLTNDERRRISSIVVEETGGKVPLVYGTGHTGIQGAVELSQEAEKAGASALMVLPPYYVKPDNERLYDYFAEVARSVDIPIMIQDASNASGVNLSVDFIIRLNKDFPNISYVKVESPPTTPKIKEIVDKSGGNLKVFGGMNGMYLIEELESGAIGTMPACEFPDVCVKIYRHFSRQEFKEARSVFYKYLPFIRIGTLGKYAMAVHKDILKTGGVINSSYVRNPNVPLTDDIKRHVYNTLEGLTLNALNWQETKLR
ncbi:dihydrodipicolinate synthase family protein [Novibacillus thermophilus]|uniref:Dihydrodipicolinate synthase family protein n=1 Tax=Novibacillus thermophilus TaxID=1471761 RepID=A0A1U9KC60_9BACL|nr:dihydrodipicolinate synthase family protein [Novibacillus thermophilus]AQS57612.1 hypothetical protein B0W44_15610 [Novibacillus thermophilus]